MMETLLKTKSSLLYIYRSKETGEFVDEDGDLTDDIYRATGYPLYSDALKGLEDFDEPENWYIVKKVINISVIGEPVEITEYI